DDRDVIQADHLAVPLRQMIRGDDRRAGLTVAAHAITSTPRTRRSRISPDATTRPMMTKSDTIHGVSYFGGSRKMTSPICVRLADTEIHDIAVLRVTA